MGRWRFAGSVFEVGSFCLLQCYKIAGSEIATCCSSTAFAAEQHYGARCLELGAGATGLPGIVAAQLGCFSQVQTWCCFVATLSADNMIDHRHCISCRLS